MLKNLFAKLKLKKNKNVYTVKIGQILTITKGGLYSKGNKTEQFFEKQYRAKKKRDKNGFIYYLLLDGEYAGQFIYASIKDVQETGDLFVYEAVPAFEVQSKYSTDSWKDMNRTLDDVEDNQNYYERLYK